MIVLFTDFGLSGPYVGQMKAVLYRNAPGVAVVDLFADAPVHNIRANAYLLAAYSEEFEAGSVFLSVVDPGVGSEQRQAVAVRCDGKWFVGPDNGLFDLLVRRATSAEIWQIAWRPDSLSHSFHGRDLFAPVAAMLSQGDLSVLKPTEFQQLRLSQWPDELAEIIYIDHFGNLITGLRAAAVAADRGLQYRGHPLPRVSTFADVPLGQPLCYENSNGLLEIALNQGRADDYFNAAIGDEIVMQGEAG
jgi:S-adenosylmethionine hydrolase